VARGLAHPLNFLALTPTMAAPPFAGFQKGGDTTLNLMSFDFIVASTFPDSQQKLHGSGDTDTHLLKTAKGGAATFVLV